MSSDRCRSTKKMSVPQKRERRWQ